jgi:hypothetical protein
VAGPTLFSSAIIIITIFILENSEFKAATTLVADSSGTAVLRPSMSNVVGQGGLAQRVVPFELALYLILTTRSV